MNLKIRKMNGETFDLPKDYIIEGTKYNPIFSDKGSQTIPITFPNTFKNRKLLEHAYRMDNIKKPFNVFPVIVESGVVQQKGLMAINEGGSSYSANIGFDESEMYNQMKTLQLKDIPDLPYESFSGVTTTDKISEAASKMNQLMKNESDADYMVFPVCLLAGRDDEKGNFDIILNEVEYQASSDNPPYGRKANLLALNARPIQWMINDEPVYIDTPVGYGVSPFLKVWRILELIFVYHYKFTIEENPFKTHRQLKKLVILNNCVDSLMTGTLYYKDLMPDITIKEFLDALYSKFGMKWYLDSNSGKIRLKFLKDIFTPLKEGNKDYSAYKTEEPKFTSIIHKQLKLIANREIEDDHASAKTGADTYDEFLRKVRFEFTERLNLNSLPTGVSNVFEMNESKYWVRFKGNNELLTSSDFFDWDKKTESGYEEIKMEDLCLPLLTTRNKIIPYYKVDIKSAYSDIDIEGKQSDQNSAKLAFIFGWGNSNHTGMFEYSYFFASQINRDSFGRWIYDGSGMKYDLSLTTNREDGLFNRFWKEYDAWMRHSGYDVTCKLKLPEHEIFNLKMFETVIINNQSLLPVEIKYKLNKKDSIAECKFKTLRLYEPYDLAIEQGIPTYYNQMYYWETSTVETPNVKNLGYPWEETSDYGDGFITIDNVNYPTKQVELLPPTEKQFQNQEEIIQTYQSVVTVDFGGGIGKRSYDVTTTVTHTPTRINYS